MSGLPAHAIDRRIRLRAAPRQVHSILSSARRAAAWARLWGAACLSLLLSASWKLLERTLIAPRYSRQPTHYRERGEPGWGSPSLGWPVQPTQPKRSRHLYILPHYPVKYSLIILLNVHKMRRRQQSTSPNQRSPGDQGSSTRTSINKSM